MTSRNDWTPIGCAVAIAICVLGACGSAQSVDRDKSENRLKLCEEFLRNMQLEAADTDCQKALAYHPANERAHNALGLIDMMRAMQVQVILETEDCVTGVDAEGLRVELDRHLAAADAHFAAAAESAPDYGEAYHNRGTVALLLGDYRAALGYFTEALARAARLDRPPLTYAGLGWVQFHLGEYPKASAELRKALRFEPGMCVAQYRLGRVYFARKEWEKAREQFERIVSQANVCPLQEAHYYLMRTYAETGLSANLPQLLEPCLKLAPASCVAARCRSLVP